MCFHLHLHSHAVGAKAAQQLSILLVLHSTFTYDLLIATVNGYVLDFAAAFSGI